MYNIGDLLFNIDSHGEVIKSVIIGSRTRPVRHYLIQDEFGCLDTCNDDEVMSRYMSNEEVRSSMRMFSLMEG